MKTYFHLLKSSFVSYKTTSNQIEKFLPFYQISCVEEKVPF